MSGNRLRIAATGLFGVVLSAAACASLSGLANDDGFPTLDDREGGLDGGDDRVVEPDAHVDGAGGDAPVGCPPGMILAHTVCIDATEVRNADYKKFLDAMAGSLGAQPALCSWNTTHQPYSDWPYDAGRDDYPVPNVSWCSALAYCAWAGKRLCGRIGSGGDPVPTNAVADAGVDEWFASCSRDGQNTYPYGTGYAPVICNARANDAGGPVPIGSKPACMGSYPGLYDMSGNVAEWENACETTDAGSKDVCYVRGGDSNSDPAAAQCSGYVRLFRGNHAGVRCCADPR